MWQLALGVLQQLSTASGIVVERNMFAYYKVPAKMLDGDSDLYYVLQCPPKLDEGIPKARDMPTCSVVDEYKEMWGEKLPRKRKKSVAKPRIQMMVPFRIVIRPLPPPGTEMWDYSRKKREDVAEGSPLKYLGQPHVRQKLLNLKADHHKFKRGKLSKGYQHMYHRDEIYNDHIFYDELQADGKFHNYGKEKSN